MASYTYQFGATGNFGAGVLSTSNSFHTSGLQSHPAVVALSQGGLFEGWQDDGTSTTNLEGGDYESFGALKTGSTGGSLNQTPTGADAYAALAALNNGNGVVAFQSGNNIKFRILSNTLSGVTGDISVASGSAAQPDVTPDVTPLNGGGFAVVYQYNYSATDHDIYGAVFNADGSVRKAAFAIDGSSLNDTDPHIAFTTDGGFVTTWTRTTGNGSSTVVAERFTSAGAANGAEFTVAGGVPLNDESAVVGLANNGFAVAYQTTRSATTADIGVATYDSTNTRTHYSAITSAYGSTFTDPSIALLPDGFLAVSTTFPDGSSVLLFALDSSLNTLASDRLPIGPGGSATLDQSAVVASGINQATVVARSTVGGDSDIVQYIDPLTQIITGDNTSETLTGWASNDKIYGNGGNDIITGGKGDDYIDGGPGFDTAVFSGASTAYTVTRDTVGGMTVSGPDGNDTLVNIEALRFSDATLRGVVPLTPRDDFGGDLKADILWRDSAGNVRLWTMNGAMQTADQPVASVPTNWHIAAVADLSGDGHADLVWRDTAGDVRLWTMNGASYDTDRPIASGIASGWKIEASGDLDGNGYADLLWRDTAGDLREWNMVGNAVQSDVSLGAVPTGWSIAGVADFDNDGKDDILWRGPNGEVRLWEMNGAAVKADLGVANIPLNWTILGVGDFGGDGRADILWESSAGEVRIWDMGGNQILNDRGLATGIASDWTVQEIADFNGDGRSDILWRSGSGEVHLWTLSAAGVYSDQTVAAVPTNWTINSQLHDYFV